MMKTLRIALLALAGLILIFLSLGLFVPSYEYQTSIAVNSTPQNCWTAFHDTTKMAQWLEGLESFKLMSGEPLASGSTYEVVINDDGHRMVMSEKILEVKAPTSVSYELSNDVLKSEFSFSFEGASSTTITSKYKVTGKNILWKSILYISKSYMASSAQKQLEGLKKVIEKE